jgi:SSS family solute:Na+ symporter
MSPEQGSFMHELSVHLGAVDYGFIIIYFIFVLGIGALLAGKMKTSSDFFQSGRSIPAWIAGLAFISANLGAQEVIGMGASGAKYGILTSHFYWIGAIPAMVFVGIFMMPFYYGSKARSVPEYLKMRFDEKTRAFNAFSFAIMTLFSSGISMYATAKLLTLLLHWDLNFAILVSAGFVLLYIFAGGLTSAIYNEVLQFFLIVAGFLPLAIIGIKDIGGWQELVRGLDSTQAINGLHPGALTHAWKNMGSTDNAFGTDWFGLTAGLGFVLSCGYWCTDFLVIQRAMAAKSMTAARKTPIIAAIPKMFFPFLVILPGMIALVLSSHAMANGGTFIPFKTLPDGSIDPSHTLDYNMASPEMLIHYLPTGLLGVGMTALLASFMSGMAGNVTAFNTICTVDIYEAYISPGRSDKHYLNVGRVVTVVGIALSVATCYVTSHFDNIMDLLQLVFGFVNAPLFATFLLGMFWKRTTGHGAFWGLLAGTLGAAFHHGLTQPSADYKAMDGGWLSHAFGLGPLHIYHSAMAQNFGGAITSFTTCFLITVLISVLTKRVHTDEQLKGLVYSLTPKPVETEPFYERPVALGLLVIAMAIVLQILFW